MNIADPTNKRRIPAISYRNLSPESTANKGGSDCKIEPPADSGPDPEGGSSRRQFIRSLAAISAGLTVAAPLGRAATVTEKSIPKSAPPNTDGVQGLTEINLKVNGNTERLVVDPRVTLLDALRDR